MLPYLKHFPVHWIDGMKISKTHFIDSANALNDHIRDAYAINLNTHNYGLLASDSGQGGMNLKLQERKLMLAECRAITEGGVRIEISESMGLMMPELYYAVPSDLSQGEYDVVITADPFERVAVGEPDAEETPPRIPYSIPAYSLDVVVSTGNRPQNYHFQLIIGKLQVSNNGLELNKDFIPPCTQVNAHQYLADIFEDFYNQLLQIHDYAQRITKKINRKPAVKELAKNIHFFSEKVAFYLAQNLDAFRHTGPQSPPIHLLAFTQALARLMRTALQCMPDQERDLVLKFFTEFLETRIGDLNQQLDHLLVETQYEHTDVLESALIPVSEFLSVVEKLFQALAEEEEYDWKKRQVHHVVRKERSGHEISGGGSSKIEPRIKPRKYK